MDAIGTILFVALLSLFTQLAWKWLAAVDATCIEVSDYTLLARNLPEDATASEVLIFGCLLAVVVCLPATCPIRNNQV